MSERSTSASQPGTSAGRVAVGHPVDVASGTLFHTFEDRVIPGRMPLAFGRRYSSALAGVGGGMFGRGWTSPYEMFLLRDLEGWRMVAEDGEAGIPFDDPEGRLGAGETVRNLGAFHELCLEGNTAIVTRWNPDSGDVIRYYFPLGGATEWWPLASRRNADDNGIDIERDAAGRIVTLRQRREGRQFWLEYDRADRVVQVRLVTPGPQGGPNPVGQQPAGQQGRVVLRYGYNAQGLLSKMEDAIGQRCRYEYDDAGRMTWEVNIGGMVYSFLYDAKGRCIRTTGQDDFGRNDLEFDELSKTTWVTDSLDNVTTYGLNDAGQVVREISPLGNTRVTVFDDHGRIVQKISPSGAESKFEYDERGDRVSETSPNGARTRYEYNARHQVTAVVDPAGNRWERVFDGAGRLIAASNPLAEITRFKYNDRGDLVEIAEPAGHVRAFLWDPDGNVAGFTDATGNTTRYAYDDAGNLIAITDPQGNTTAAKVDDLGRIRELRLPDGASRRFARNAYDQLTDHIDELGAVTQWRYAGCGLLVQLVRPDGSSVQLEWSTIPGQLLAMRNERGERYVFEYDADGRVTREVDFQGGAYAFEHDADGRIKRVRDPAGRTNHIKYDGNAVTAVQFDDGARTTYRYDIRGLLVAADNGDCPVAREYDALGRIILERQGRYEVRSEFDVSGNRVRRSGTFEVETAFEWTPNGQLSKLSSRSQAPIEFRYDAGMNEVSRFVPDGVRIDLQYDSRQRMVDQRVGRNTGRSYTAGRVAVGGDNSIHRTFGYDAAGNLIGLVDAHRGDSRYEYDVRGRLVAAMTPDGFTERLSYDLTDNIRARTMRPNDGPLATFHGEADWTYAAGDVLVQRDDVRYERDGAGRVVLKTEPGGVTSYEWNAYGHLAAVVLPDGRTWRYVYDAFGRRVRKTGPDSVVEFVWDGDVVLHEIRNESSKDSTVVDWEFDPYGFAPIRKIEGGDLFLCLNDAAGMPRELLDVQGNVAWSGRFTTYGETRTVDRGDGQCPVRFQGQWFDEESGLCYNRHRYYDPGAGRYISPDPLGYVGGLNLMNFVTNPTGWIDPLGLANSTCPHAIALGLDLGGVGGGKSLADPKKGIIWYKQWADFGITRRKITFPGVGRAIHQATKRASKIHFSLDGIPDPQAAVKAGKKGFVQDNITNAELHHVASNPELLAKTTFYRNGAPVDSPF
jgi:RHS repeat-associated protein